MLLLSIALMFPNLGDRPLMGDSAWTVLLAENTLKYGYPKYWDGNHLITTEIFESDDEYYMYPQGNWLPIYATAFFFLVFGKSIIAGRFLFALFGMASVPLFYKLAKRITNLTTARIATLLLVTSTHLYLYSRNVHYYSMALFFGIATLYSYLKFTNKEKYSTVYLIISLSLLFHTHAQAAMIFALSIGIHYLVFYRKNIKSGLYVVAGFLILTLPWILLTNQFARVFSGTKYISATSSSYSSEIFSIVLIASTSEFFRV